MTSIARLFQAPHLPWLPDGVRGRQVVVIDGAVLGDAQRAAALLAPLRALRPEVDTFDVVPAASLAHLHLDPEEPTAAYVNSLLLDELPDRAVEALVDTAGPGSGSGLLFVEIRQLGGALSRPSPRGGALDRIDGSFLVLGVGVDPGGAAGRAPRGSGWPRCARPPTPPPSSSGGVPGPPTCPSSARRRSRCSSCPTPPRSRRRSPAGCRCPSATSGRATPPSASAGSPRCARPRPCCDDVALKPAIDSVHTDPLDLMPVYEAAAVLTDFPAEAADALVAMTGPGSASPQVLVEVRQMGGAVARGGEHASAFCARKAAYALLTVGMSDAPGVDAHADAVLDSVRPWIGGHRMPNFTFTAAEYRDAYDAPTLARLRAAIRTYDPHGVMAIGHALAG